MGSHRHLRFPSMSFIYKCSFRKPEWCFCFSRFGEESFFASTVTRLKPALSVFSIAIELKLIIACKGTDNKLVSQDGFHRTLTLYRKDLTNCFCSRIVVSIHWPSSIVCCVKVVRSSCADTWYCWAGRWYWFVPSRYWAVSA